MPRPSFSGQYQCGVVVFEAADFPMAMEDCIKIACEYEATTEDPEDGGTMYCVRFPDRPDEVYSEKGMMSSLRSFNKKATTN